MIKRRRVNGFTLVEIIAVIIILGIVAIIIVPGISRYITGGRETNYDSQEKSMIEATKAYIAECIANNDLNCSIPDNGEKSLYGLGELVSKGYIDRIKDTSGEGFCREDASYVEVSGLGDAKFEYKACLYCSSYQTDDPTCVTYVDTGKAPSCGAITGQSSEWTNKDRTITVKCDDTDVQCLKSEFSKTFTSTAMAGSILISSKDGSTKSCDVNVYVDKDLPTCELEVSSGTLESTGWYSGDVKVRLKSTSDVGSGLLTYGIGTSVEKRNYNREKEIKVGLGTTTVIGYVKDYAGNENICSLDVRVGTSKPEFDVEYGYQIFPNKESYSLGNMTQNGNSFTTTSNDPLISFTGLSEYRSVNKVVVYFKDAIPQTVTGQVFYSNGTYSETNSKKVLLVQGRKMIEFEIPTGTYSNIRIDFGDVSGLTYNVDRIELRVGDRSLLYTNKDVTVALIPKNEVIKTTGYSFDDGATWQDSNTKIFSTIYNGNAKLRNSASMVSNSVSISIPNIDKVAPSCTIYGDGNKTASGVFTNGATVRFSNASDGAATSQYAQSGVRSYGFGNAYGNKTDTLLTSDASKTFTGYIVDKAGNSATCTVNLVGDSVPPTVSYSVAGGNYNTNKTIRITPSDSGSGVAGYNIHVYKDGSILNIYNNLTAAYYDVTLSSDGSYTVYTQVVDKAGNKIVQTPNNGSNWYYQSYKIDKTAPTCTTSKSGSGSGGVTISWSCSDTNGVSSVTYNGSGVGASGNYGSQKSSATIVAKDSFGNSSTYTVTVTKGQNCTTYTEHWCCVGGWCGWADKKKKEPYCCDSYRCPLVERQNCTDNYY